MEPEGFRAGFTSYNAHSVYQNQLFSHSLLCYCVSHLRLHKKNLRFKTAGFIGLSEFESETSCPPDKHANQLRYSPLCFEIIAHLKKSCKCLAAFCAENNFQNAFFQT